MAVDYRVNSIDEIADFTKSFNDEFPKSGFETPAERQVLYSFLLKVVEGPELPEIDKQYPNPEDVFNQSNSRRTIQNRLRDIYDSPEEKIWNLSMEMIQYWQSSKVFAPLAKCVDLIRSCGYDLLFKKLDCAIAKDDESEAKRIFSKMYGKVSDELEDALLDKMSEYQRKRKLCVSAA